MSVWTSVQCFKPAASAQQGPSARRRFLGGCSAQRSASAKSRDGAVQNARFCPPAPLRWAPVSRRGGLTQPCPADLAQWAQLTWPRSQQAPSRHHQPYRQSVFVLQNQGPLLRISGMPRGTHGGRALGLLRNGQNIEAATHRFQGSRAGRAPFIWWLGEGVLGRACLLCVRQTATEARKAYRLGPCCVAGQAALAARAAQRVVNVACAGRLELANATQ